MQGLTRIDPKADKKQNLQKNIFLKYLNRSREITLFERLRCCNTDRESWKRRDEKKNILGAETENNNFTGDIKSELKV